MMNCFDLYCVFGLIKYSIYLYAKVGLVKIIKTHTFAPQVMVITLKEVDFFFFFWEDDTQPDGSSQSLEVKMGKKNT